MKSKTILFICHNSFNGTLVAGYLQALLPTDYRVRVTTISGLSQNILDKHDIIVCLGKMIYHQVDFAHKLLALKTVVWNVQETNETKLKALCNDFKIYLTKGSWVDITTSENKNTGLRLPISWATDRGLWHRGAHLILFTKDHKMIVEKRSMGMVTEPGELDISLGGIVDSGETPMRSILREAREELGVTLRSDQLEKLFVSREEKEYRKLRKRVRTIKSVYTAVLDDNQVLFSPQVEEVSGIATLTITQTLELIKKGSLANVGTLSTGREFYKKAVKSARKSLLTKKTGFSLRQKVK